MKNISLLLVDDDPLVIQSVKLDLSERGFIVTTASNGKEAVEILNKKHFDLVITDLVIGEIDGIQLLKKAKNLNSEMIVIILTGYGDFGSSVDALRLDADDYLNKPCDPEELCYRINNCFEKLANQRTIKYAENALKKAHEELELRIEKKTDELEVAKKNLEIKKAELEKTNDALTLLLEKRGKDKTEIKENMLFNIKGLVMPYLEKVINSNIGDQQKACLEVIKTNLDDMCSSYTRNLASPHLNFTPAEIKIANFIKYGKSSKEIADVLCMSKKTIDIHRYHIRKKIGIKNKKANLRTNLLALKET
jgi:DNA-binding NarL/FixJ family response regulator